MKTLILALFLGGCSMQPIETLSINSEDFTPEQIETLIKGFDAWPHVLDVSTCTGQDCTVTLGGPKCSGTVAGYADLSVSRPGRIVICPLALEDEEMLRLTATHELGHAVVGASDHLPEGNVMAKTSSKMVPEPTELDLQYAGLR